MYYGGITVMPCPFECDEVESLISLNPHNLLGIMIVGSCDHDFPITTSQVVHGGPGVHACQGEHLLDYKMGRRVERSAQCRFLDAVGELRMSAHLSSDTILVGTPLADRVWPEHFNRLWGSWVPHTILQPDHS